MWRGTVLIVLLAALRPAWPQAAGQPAADSVPGNGSPPCSEVPAPQAGGQPPRPSTPVLREDLQDILARPEFRARGKDWLWELKLRLLRAVIQWWEERVAPLFSDLRAAQPVVYWTIFAVLLLLLTGILYHIYTSLRSAFGSNVRHRGRAADATLPQRLGGPEELLREADAAAGKGQFALAFRWLYLALIRQLDRKSLLRFDGSATNHDYLRQLGAHPEITRHLEPLTRAVEPVWYGYQTATPEDYQRCREWVLAAWQEGGPDAAL
jgi:hypothetical protein